MYVKQIEELLYCCAYVIGWGKKKQKFSNGKKNRSKDGDRLGAGGGVEGTRAMVYRGILFGAKPIMNDYY